MAALPSQHLAQQLTRLALPHIPTHGFTSHALKLASSELPPPHSPARQLDERTLHALYPSPPVSHASPTAFSLKGLAIGNGGKRSLSRHELIALARGQGSITGDPKQAGRERTGPARALVHEWLRAGRKQMVKSVRESGLKGEDAMRMGVRARLEYNEPVLAKLPDALALLSAPTTTYLTSLSALLPFPSPAPHLYHVAQIAQDLAKASGSEAQGTAWYSLRLRLSLIYALSEFHLLSSASPSSPLSPAEAIEDAVALSERLFDTSQQLGKQVDDAGLFAQWVARSWMGIGRSMGV
ncbi:hypothetical protein JCM1840_000814 [Sporobolomyces johnsonii]